MSDKLNSKIYYAKISDELIRHYRLRSYILEQNSYLSFSKLIYNISENEIILPQSYITKEYFDSFKNKNKLTLNKYIYTNTYDNSSIDHTDLQKYNKKINYNDIVLEKEEKEEKNEMDEKEANKVKTGKRFNIVTNLKREKCYNIKDISSKKLRENILNGYREREYFRSKNCNQFIPSDLFNKTLTVEEVKNTLIIKYKELLSSYGSKLYDILLKEGNNIDNVKEGKETLESNIISDRYFLTIMDIFILGISSNIGVLYFNSIITKEKKIIFIKNGNYEKNIILIQGAKAMLHHGDKQLMPKFSIVIKEDEDIYHNIDELTDKIKNNNYNIEFYTIDQYINNDIQDNEKAKNKIKLKE